MTTFLACARAGTASRRAERAGKRTTKHDDETPKATLRAEDSTGRATASPMEVAT